MLHIHKWDSRFLTLPALSLINYFRPRNTLLYRGYVKTVPSLISSVFCFCIQKSRNLWRDSQTPRKPRGQQRSVYLPLGLYVEDTDLCGFPHFGEDNIILILCNDTHQLDIWVIRFFFSLDILFLDFISLRQGLSGQSGQE